jgi:hypothetical protein
MLAKYDSHDHLHPGDEGYEAMAEAVDLKLFGGGHEGGGGGGAIDPDGEPPDAPGEHYALWREGRTWHLRAIAKEKEQHFRGQIVLVGPGTLGAVTIENPARFVEGPQKKGVRFDFAAEKGASDGLDFAVTDEKAALSFTLEIGEKDPKFEPEKILVGKRGAHPEKSPFALPAHAGEHGGGGGDKVARERAEAAWKATLEAYAVPGQPGFYSNDPGEKKPGAIWPLGQGIAAAVDMAGIGESAALVKQMMAAIEAYRQGDGYGFYPHSPPNANRGYDDNGCTGIAIVQAYELVRDPRYLEDAKRVLQFVKTGEGAEGGVKWEEKSDPREGGMPATGFCAEFALRLYRASHEAEALEFAEKCRRYMQEHLRVGPDEKDVPQGLYWNDWGPKGGTEGPAPGPSVQGRTLWTYNQGLPIGVDVLLFQATGKKEHLEHAKETAGAALAYFSKEDRLWKQPPAFNVVLFRNLLFLDKVAPEPAYREALERYLDRVWAARDPKTGLFDQGGIAHYGKRGPNFLDQCSLVQLFALAARGEKGGGGGDHGGDDRER